MSHYADNICVSCVVPFFVENVFKKKTRAFPFRRILRRFPCLRASLVLSVLLSNKEKGRQKNQRKSRGANERVSHDLLSGFSRICSNKLDPAVEERRKKNQKNKTKQKKNGKNRRIDT